MLNDQQLDSIRDFKKFAPTFLTIRTKSGQPNNFALNKAQLYLHERLETQRKATGKVRAIILKGRQQGCCFSPEMRVLNNKYQWIKLADVKIGDELFGIDEEPIGKSKTGRNTDRKIQITTVEAKIHLKKEAFEVALSNGVKLIVTGEHRMLFKQRGGCLNQWRTISMSKVGDDIRAFSPPPEDIQPTIDRQADIIRILSMTRPSRFIEKSEFVGKSLPNSCDGFDAWAKIESIKSVGEIEVIDLQTSTKTFICEGLVSHNSTYIQARFFHQVITSRGKKAFILTHDKEATKNLFSMAQRFYENLEAGLVPKPDTANAKELYFKEFDSGYAVGTAGNKAVGRSQTIQLMHSSEVAYWQFAEEHSKGIMQAISNESGTEIILESTANGIGNYFHSRWLSAVSADNEYQAIFIPWYWQDEYKYDAENMFLTEEEQHYFELYSQNGLTKEHLAWRRIKIGEFSKDYDAGKEHFQVEYPFSATEAFKNPINNVFINSKYVEKARQADVEPNGPLIIGVDVAISDRDRTAIIRRKGRHAFNLEKFQNYNTMEIVGRLKRIINNEHPLKMYIDCIGIGAGVVDRLQEMGFDCVEGVNVARSANDKEKFKNLRAELWSDMRDWFYGELPVQIPDDDEMHGELCSLGFKENSSGQLQIESKDDLRSRGLPSPDSADALALSFFGGCYGVANSSIEVDKLSPWENRMFR